MSLITSHVLDAGTGTPAVGVDVCLLGADGATIAQAATDDDGRVTDLGPASLPAGVYRIEFDTGAYFAGQGVPTFYPSVTVTIAVEGAAHYHVPLLLSPFSYSTYRGS